MHIGPVRYDIVFSSTIDHEIDWPLSDSGGLLAERRMESAAFVGNRKETCSKIICCSK